MLRSNILQVFLGITMAFAACWADDNPHPRPGLPVSTMSAAINNTAWSAMQAQMQQVNGGLEIYGIKNPTAGKTSSFLMSIKHYGGLSTYYIDWLM